MMTPRSFSSETRVKVVPSRVKSKPIGVFFLVTVSVLHLDVLSLILLSCDQSYIGA